MAIERLLTGSIRDQVQELMSTEDLVIEAFRALVKDELKAHIRNKVDEDPELKAEIKEAVAYYFHTKARTVYAELKATRAATRLGLQLISALCCQYEHPPFTRAYKKIIFVKFYL